MVRTQAQLTDKQLKALKELSAKSGQSVADLIRQGVDRLLEGRGEVSREERIKRALEVVGRFTSDRTDVSSRHDDYLAEAFGE